MTKKTKTFTPLPFATMRNVRGLWDVRRTSPKETSTKMSSNDENVKVLEEGLTAKCRGCGNKPDLKYINGKKSSEWGENKYSDYKYYWNCCEKCFKEDDDSEEEEDDEKKCNHKWECGCDKDYCDGCKEYAEETGEEYDTMCEDEKCKAYYQCRNDNCDCGTTECPYCSVSCEEEEDDSDSDSDSEDEDDGSNTCYGIKTRTQKTLVMSGGHGDWWNYVVVIDDDGEQKELYIETKYGLELCKDQRLVQTSNKYGDYRIKCVYNHYELNEDKEESWIDNWDL